MSADLRRDQNTNSFQQWQSIFVRVYEIIIYIQEFIYELTLLGDKTCTLKNNDIKWVAG